MSNLLFMKIGNEINLKSCEQPSCSSKKQSSTIRSSLYAREVIEQKNKSTNTGRESSESYRNQIKNQFKINLSGLTQENNIKMLDSMESQGIFNEVEQNRKKKKITNDHSHNQSNHITQSIYSSLEQQGVNQQLSKDILVKSEKKQKQKRKSMRRNQSNFSIKQKFNEQLISQIKSHRVQNKETKATKQLIDQQNSIEVQQKNPDGNQKLEGWVIKNTMKNFYSDNHGQESMRVNHSSSSSTSPHSKKQLINYQRNKYFYFSPSNAEKSSKLISKNSRNTRPGSKNNRINNQIATSQFLKQLKLKYAKIAQQKCEHEQLSQKNFQPCHNRMHSHDQNIINYVAVNNHQRNKTEDILIEEGKSKSFINYNETSQCNFCLINVNPNQREEDKNQKFTKYSNIRIHKKINTEEHINQIKSGIQKFRQKFGKDDKQKVSYETLFHGTDSKSKSRLNFNIKSEERNLTIDPSQLSCSRGNANQYIGYAESKRKRIHFPKQLEKFNSKTPKNNRLSKLNLVDKNAEGLELINQMDCNSVEQKNKLIKIKLKYLKNLKINPNLNLNTIETRNIERAKIMPQIGSLKKINYYSQNIIKGSISTKNHTDIPWQERITARGGQDFEKLKKLLKKQEGQAVYLLFEKERASKNSSEMKDKHSNFYKLNTANNNI